MSAKHTPGPWVAVDVTGQNTLVYRRIDAGGKSVGFAGAYKLPNKNEAEANARLIAAAPEMFHALELARAIIARNIGDYHGILGHIEKVRAKATGATE